MEAHFYPPVCCQSHLRNFDAEKWVQSTEISDFAQLALRPNPPQAATVNTKSQYFEPE
jgi:hypothetical protein